MVCIDNIDLEWGREEFPERITRALEILKVDPDKAIKSLSELADAGSSLAMLYLGDTYSNGRGGGARRIDLGKMWYERAAARGSIEAAHRVAFICFHQGDYARAIEILTKLAKGGFSPALYCLGSFYYVGTGVDKSIMRAVVYWRAAESRGHLEARRGLSTVLRSGAFGFAGRLMGIIKVIMLIIPYARYSVSHPNGDRLRGW